MSNTLVNDKIVAQEAIGAFSAALAPFNAFSTDFSGDAGKVGGSVSVPVVSAMTAGTFSGNYETGDTTASEKEVALSTHIFRSVHLSDVESGSTSMSAVAQIREAAEAVAKLAFTTVFANVTIANYATEIVCSSIDSDQVADIAKSADDLNWSEANRALVLNNALTNALRKDDTIKGRLDITTAVDGVLPKLSGFSPYRSAAMPTTQHLVGVASHKSAMAVAMRTVKPQDTNLVSYEIVVDPSTGIPLGIRTWYSPASGKKWTTVEVLLGSAVAKGTGLIRLVSEAN